MSLPKSKLTSQNQIAIPLEIRRKLGLVPGSFLEWDEDAGIVFVRKVVRFSSEDIHQAVFAKRPIPHSLKKLKGAIRKHGHRKHAHP
jgi:AbrB family looped-hinge helix DNA binding protein